MLLYTCIYFALLEMPKVRGKTHYLACFQDGPREVGLWLRLAQAKNQAVLRSENAARSCRRRRWIWWRKRIKAAQRLAASLAHTVRHPPDDRARRNLCPLTPAYVCESSSSSSIRRIVVASLNYSQLRSLARRNIFE